MQHSRMPDNSGCTCKVDVVVLRNRSLWPAGLQATLHETISHPPVTVLIESTTCSLQVTLAKPQQVGLNLGVLADDTDFETWSDAVHCC